MSRPLGGGTGHPGPWTAGHRPVGRPAWRRSG